MWLLIDADDTLWENSIYFDRAFEQFVELLDHSHLAAPEIREVLDEIESESIRTHGYGSANFGRHLQICFERLAERHYNDLDLEKVMELARRILNQPLELIDGVETTLNYLAGRHQLTLFSKGHPEEQHMKIERSGLGGFFTECRIVKEKDAAAYRQIIEERRMDPASTWMVGNSPKSDINPALAAGLAAVLVPNENTWSLEREPLPPPSERFRVVDRFSDLRQLF
jgi:putative hydrolase of the HAD superfamily